MLSQFWHGCFVGHLFSNRHFRISMTPANTFPRQGMSSRLARPCLLLLRSTDAGFPSSSSHLPSIPHPTTNSPHWSSNWILLSHSYTFHGATVFQHNLHKPSNWDKYCRFFSYDQDANSSVIVACRPNFVTIQMYNKRSVTVASLKIPVVVALSVRCLNAMTQLYFLQKHNWWTAQIMTLPSEDLGYPQQVQCGPWPPCEAIEKELQGIEYSLQW